MYGDQLDDSALMSHVNSLLTLLGTLVLVLSLTSGLLKSKPYLPTQPLVALVVGVLIGPELLGWIRLSHWGDPTVILEEVTRLTIGFSVMAAALRIPRTYFGDATGAMATLLGPGQLLMAGVSGLLTHWLLGLPFWTGMLVGTIVTPTDPVLASTIVTGQTAKENIPERLRHLLSAESGANDGGAYPLVFAAILMIRHPVGVALPQWLRHVLLWEVAFAILAGVVVGGTAGKIQTWALDNDVLDRTPLLTVTLSLTVAVLGAIRLAGSDGILAVFVAGLAFNRVAPGDPETKQGEATDTLEHLLTIPAFLLFGTHLPWEEWVALGWAGVALVVGTLLFRRLPMLFALKRFVPSVETRVDAALAGWFGPIGIAGIYYATLAHHETGSAEPWVVGSLVVAGAIVVYGVTTTAGTQLYGRRTGHFRQQTDRERQQEGSGSEGTAAAE